MIIGIGTDIVQTARLHSSLEKVRNRCFTAAEIAYAEAFKDSIGHYAGRWAAKEALAKALGCGFGQSCEWQDIEILNNDNGKPEMRLSGKAADTFNSLHGKTIHLSISHEKDYATAFVILED
ncbi:MAG: holo-[acyl-carrier-protein] synthase [Lentisphaerae bacterium]|nr:holo-[acyl-carrier-protein] synthase [Lentisphaerota bacterium]